MNELPIVHIPSISSKDTELAQLLASVEQAITLAQAAERNELLFSTLLFTTDRPLSSSSSFGEGIVI
ncbi:hypothetical protein VB735_20500 [Halotia wernerae UHCC 0503]|nr:hypothetical protein [Halotia wernerae UHCC 0503]